MEFLLNEYKLLCNLITGDKFDNKMQEHNLQHFQIITINYFMYSLPKLESTHQHLKIISLF